MNSGAVSVLNDQYPLHTVTLGNGPRHIVMLHGWGRNLESLRPLGELLAKDFTVTLLDLPGFGRSPLPPEASNDGGGWGTHEYMLKVKGWLEQSGIRGSALVGHSFGGRISVRLAAQFPELVEAVVLIGAHGLKRERPLQEEIRVKTIRLLSSTAKKVDSLTGSRIFAHYFAPRFGSTDYKNAGELRRTLVKTVNEDLTPEASQVEARALLLWGENDREAPLDIARNYHRLIRSSELHIFPRKGHEPFADVGSHLIARYIERFLQQRGVRDS